MSSQTCELGPNGKSCGAFATGRCSDCHRAVCRYHGLFFEDRLLCVECKSKIDGAREAEQEAAQAAQRERVKERRAAEADLERELDDAWASLPVMKERDVLTFLTSRTPADLSDQKRPTAQGMRFPRLDKWEFAAMIQYSDIPSRRVRTTFHHVGWFRWYNHGQAWLIGSQFFTYEMYGDTMGGICWLAVCEGAVVAIAGDTEDRLEVNQVFDRVSWSPTPAMLEETRKVLGLLSLNGQLNLDRRSAAGLPGRGG